MKRVFWMLLIGATPWCVGCGGSGGGTAQVPTQAPTTQTQPLASNAPELSPAAEIVAQFLDGVRRGDEVTAAKFFTAIAVEEIKKSGYEFAPPGTPDATFALGKTAYTDEEKDTAYVQVNWIEPDPNGGPSQTTEAVFVMRLEEAGWRIASLVVDELQLVKDAEGQERQESVPIALDFENLTQQAQMAQLATQAPPNGAQTTAQPNAQTATQPNGAPNPQFPSPTQTPGPAGNFAVPSNPPPALTPPSASPLNTPQNQLRPSSNAPGTQLAQPPQPGSSNFKR